MATTTEKNTAPSTGDPFAKIAEQGEEFLRVTRKAGVQYIDLYEKSANRAIELERSVANATNQDWLKGLIDGHADFATSLTDAYASAARELLK